MKKKLLYALELVISGVLVGLLVSLFLYLSSLCIRYVGYIADCKMETYVILCVITTAISIWLVAFNSKFIGHLGSGIHVLEEYYDDIKDYNSYILVPVMFINSFMAYIKGYILGTEAPSIFIGASITKIIARIFRNEDKELVKGGASAGFAVAFLAPIAGFLHLIEEHMSHISLKTLIKGLFVIAIAYITAYLVYPRHPFHFLDIKLIPLKYIYIVICVAILSTLVAALYRLMHHYVGRLSKYGLFMVHLTPILGLMFTLFVRFAPTLSRNGEFLAEESLLGSGLLVLMMILIGRLVLMFLSESAYVSGGSVLPLLALGAVCSEIIMKAFKLGGVDVVKYEDTIVLVGMCTCFGASASVPVTSIALGIEITRSAYVLWPLLVSLVVATLVKSLINRAYYGRRNNKKTFEQNDTV